MTGSHRNILLLTADSLRPDALGAYGGAAKTENLDTLAADGSLFARAFSTGSSTPQSFRGILASNYPTNGSMVYEFGNRMSLARVLQDAGFKTGAFHSSPFLSAVRRNASGFDHFFDLLLGGEESGKTSESGCLKQTCLAVARLIARSSRPAYRLLRKIYWLILRPRSVWDEQDNRIKSEPEEAREMRARLGCHFERERPLFEPSSTPPAGPALSPEDEEQVRDQLRGLGYLD